MLRVSSLEAPLFDALGIPAEYRQVKIGTRTADAVLADKKIVLELNGCYYHACPFCLLEKQFRTGDARHVEVWENDSDKYSNYLEAGYCVLVIWGSTNNPPVSKLELIKGFLSTFRHAGKPRVVHLHGGAFYSFQLGKYTDGTVEPVVVKMTLPVFN